ncbi:sensor histidine kinase [Novosphingobium profundi]|uniref:sensor histidine kinase n=1 Tax=Novosphingobium profundi TaxID=1774954 RepID=UPI001BD97612|nr:ATP-binding protein [Novosphingobium profundi]MBT0669198.1 sensor histidine kinase [Novosphingobium profundi]
MGHLHLDDRPARAGALRTWLPRRPDLPLLLAYGAAFAALHWMARPWGGGSGFYSLWYPAAGLRFAVLWSRGSRLAPALMVCEVVTDWLTGALVFTGPHALHDTLGVLRPGFSTAIAISLVRSVCERNERTLCVPPMPLGLAALAAPVLSGILVVPLDALLDARAFAASTPSARFLSLTGMVVGDLLGILVLAPALLWLAGLIDTPRRPRLGWPACVAWPPRVAWQSPLAWLTDALVLGLCLALTLALWKTGLGLQPSPAMLGGAWIGLRHGRGAAWLTILADLALFLPYSALELEGAVRIELHLGIAGVVIVTWLAGSFADAQVAARHSLDKRNRLLFQAERLKTLRAMSVAVIHEISQPLSTLAIEAGHLHREAARHAPDIAESAALVDRKARTLSELVRRLRRFGGRDLDEPSALPVAMLVAMVRQMVAQDVAARGKTLRIAPMAPDLVVHGQEIELAQALLNLVRNALAQTCDGLVEVRAVREGSHVALGVSNAFDPAAAHSNGPGMGVGLMIVRSIVEAHDGRLEREDGDGFVRFTLLLPALETTP